MRYEAIPEDAVKVTPDTDVFPPVLHAGAWEEPVPLEGPFNTAGGEDSPFISPDGDLFLFFFTPDVTAPAEEQVTDGVTGIWASRLEGGDWTEPVFVDLSDVPSLEGCPTLFDLELWFCSIREGNYGEVDAWVASYSYGGDLKWSMVRNAGSRLNRDLDIGEWHLAGDGDTLYFGWDSPEGRGASDIWMVTWNGETWEEPLNLGPAINTAGSESRPFVTPNRGELWFTGSSRLGYHGPAVFRSVRADTGWTSAEEIISNYAAEPCLDAAGNVYFIHHFMDEEERMIEADVYSARPR
jgi:hypothetical protein